MKSKPRKGSPGAENEAYGGVIGKSSPTPSDKPYEVELLKAEKALSVAVEVSREGVNDAELRSTPKPPVALVLMGWLCPTHRSGVEPAVTGALARLGERELGWDGDTANVL
jgi:hypothetical protein